MDSEANIKGLTKLQELANEGLITFDASINGGEEIALFVNGTSRWLPAGTPPQVANNKDKLADGIELFPMAFPSEDGVPRLDGGVLGFGLFDNGDDEKVAAAKEFIRFICDDADAGPAAACTPRASSPVRASVGRPVHRHREGRERRTTRCSCRTWATIYKVTPGWNDPALPSGGTCSQRIFAGGDVATEVATCIVNVNLQSPASPQLESPYSLMPFAALPRSGRAPAFLTGDRAAACR